MWILARKEFFVRYRRTSFGLLWAVGLPLFQAAVLAGVFSKVIHIGSGKSFVVFVLAGVTPWSFFSFTLATASTAIVDNAAMSSKIYFPRIVLPIVTVLANLYGFLITIPVLVGFSVIFGIMPSVSLVWLLPGVLLSAALGGTLSVVLSALHVYFRDIRYLVQAALTGWIYLTPVIYPLSVIPRSLRWLVELNPATGPVELFRKALVGADHSWALTVGVSCGWVVAFALLAVLLHRRFDRQFADLM